MTRFKDYLLLHFLVLIWGFTGIIGVFVLLPAPVLVAYRTGLATLGLWVLLKIQGKSILIPKVMPLLLTGVVIWLHWFLFFGAARISNVSISLVGLSTQALFTSFLEPLYTRRRISLLEVVLGLVVVVGLYLVYSSSFQYSLGLWMSVGSALTGAVFSILNGNFAHKYSAEHVTFYEMGGAFLSAVVVVVLMLLFAPQPNFDLVPSSMDWLWLVVLAWGCTIFPFTQSVKLMKKISVYTLNLTLNLEPVYGILLAYYFLGEKEKMTSDFYIGGGIILLSVIVYPFFKKR